MPGPPAPQSTPNGDPPRPPSVAAARRHTVLVAEDEEAVRKFVCVALEQAGFEVVAAADGHEAAELFAADPVRFDLILTDVTMPRALGTDLAARARQLRPTLPVLFMSAYAGGAGGAPEPLLEKPFTVAALLAAVGAALGVAAG